MLKTVQDRSPRSDLASYKRVRGKILLVDILFQDILRVGYILATTVAEDRAAPAFLPCSQVAILLEETEPDLCDSCKNTWGKQWLILVFFFNIYIYYSCFFFCLFVFWLFLFVCFLAVFVCLLLNGVLPDNIINIIQLSLGNLTFSSEN